MSLCWRTFIIHKPESRQ